MRRLQNLVHGRGSGDTAPPVRGRISEAKSVEEVLAELAELLDKRVVRSLPEHVEKTHAGLR